MLNWISSNYQWLFSGAGVLLISAIFGYLKHKKSNKSDRDISTNAKSSVNNVVNIDIRNHTDAAKTDVKNATVFNHSVDLKAHAHILFIDDERFNMINILKQAGWKNIEYKKDIIDLYDNAILTANIIFVDINGVGCSISKKQGLGLAAAIKDKHPNKYVVIYSAEPNGNRFDSDLRKVDDCLPKNAEPIQFMNLIEDFANKICNGK